MRAPSRCRPGSTPPGCRTPFHRLKVDCITVMLAGPVTVFDRRLAVYSRRSPFLSADRALNPELRLIRPSLSPVGATGLLATSESNRAQPGSTRPVHHVWRKDGHFRAHAMRSVPLRDAAAGRLRVAMTDRDIIERLQAITGLGLVHDRGRRHAHWKQVWDWTVLRRENMCAIAEALAPLLLQRRREQIAFIFHASGISIPPPISPTCGEPRAWRNYRRGQRQQDRARSFRREATMGMEGFQPSGHLSRAGHDPPTAWGAQGGSRKLLPQHRESFLRGERRTRTATRTPSRFRGGARDPGGFTLHIGSPRPTNGGEMAEDDGPDPQRLRRPPGFQPRPAARLVHPPYVQLTTARASPRGRAAVNWTAYCTSAIRRRSCWPAVQRKASDSNATVSPAHPLATEPGS
jgi:hypothetical protein